MATPVKAAEIKNQKPNIKECDTARQSRRISICLENYSDAKSVIQEVSVQSKQQMPALVPNLNLAEAETERQINLVTLDQDFELAREKSIKKNCMPVVSAISETPTVDVFEP